MRLKEKPDLVLRFRKSKGKYGDVSTDIVVISRLVHVLVRVTSERDYTQFACLMKSLCTIDINWTTKFGHLLFIFNTLTVFQYMLLNGLIMVYYLTAS